MIPTAVLGGGAWGTGMAVHLARRSPGTHPFPSDPGVGVMFWARDAQQRAEMRLSGENRKYLPGIRLEPGIRIADTLDEALVGARLVMLAVPLAALRGILEQIAGQGADQPPQVLVWLCKGLESGTALLPHQIVAQCCPGVAGVALSGPSFAQELAAGLPLALVAASQSPGNIDLVRGAVHHFPCRVYASDDLPGVELGGALKNVMAIAAGVSDGLGMGNNARAALLTRGLAEIARLGGAIGARQATFMGLSGLGDLLLSATGDLSRNRQVGLRLARGESLEVILGALGHVAEGVPTASTAVHLAQRHGIDMPITQAVHDLLAGASTPQQALRALLAREWRSEREVSDPWA